MLVTVESSHGLALIEQFALFVLPSPECSICYH